MATLVRKPVATEKAQQRRHDLDWLRAGAVAVVFLYHNARFFGGEYWQIGNTQRSFVVDALAGFVGLWLMPLFFLLAGASSRFALASESPGRYVWKRFRRLVVPFLVGIFILAPPQAYVEALLYSSFRGSFLEFYPRFFIGRLEMPHRSLGWLFAGFGYHLWFLGFLFVYSTLALPLFRFLGNTESGRLLVANLARWTRGRSILWWVVPAALAQVALRARFPHYLDVADFAYWFVFFVYGYLLCADQRLTRAVESQGRTAFVIGVASFLGLVAALYAGRLANWMLRPSYSPGFMLFQLFSSLDAWAWLIVILSLAARHLSFRNPTLDYANEAVLPFYILHEPLIMMIGFVVVGWHVSIFFKYPFLVAASFAVTLALYEFVVKRTRITRALFGMKLRDPRAG